jgi:DNA-binding NtrC family response regulator
MDVTRIISKLRSERTDKTGRSIEAVNHSPLNVPSRIVIGNKVIPLLSVSPIQNDHDTLAGLLDRDQWRIHSALSLRSASAFVRAHRVPLVICEHDLWPGSWTQLLDEIRLLSLSPFLVVTSRVADDYLWAEALNMGAYDVLAGPFDLTEVTRILSSAWRHWHDQYEAPMQSPTTVSEPTSWMLDVKYALQGAV